MLLEGRPGVHRKREGIQQWSGVEIFLGLHLLGSFVFSWTSCRHVLCSVVATSQRSGQPIAQ